MNAKEEKILGLFEEKNELFDMDDVAEAIGELSKNTYRILSRLSEEKKVKQIMYDKCLFWASKETMLAFEKKRRELESEFGIV